MSAPSKPWEQRILQSSAPIFQVMPGERGSSRARANLPSVPPRPNMIGPTSFMSSPYNRPMGLGGLGYNSYDSYNSYGGFNNYGSYPGYRGNLFGSYGGFHGNAYGYGPESRFIQMAEESTRGAFQGIESLVRAFGSVAMMLDSTFFAVQSSFRAVLGVAENFGRIRTMFGQLWSSFALLRFINWCYNRLLLLLGVKRAEDLGRAAWSEAVQATTEGVQPNTSSWPIFMFLGMIVSAPYLISKLLPPLIDKRDPKNWGAPGRLAIALHQFQASNPQELSMYAGEKIVVAPQGIQQEMGLSSSGWVFAAGEQGTGIIPMNYIQLVTRKYSAPKVAPAGPSAPPGPQEERESKVELGEHFKKAEESSQGDK